MIFRLNKQLFRVKLISQQCKKVLSTQPVQNTIELNNNKFYSDDYFNLTPKILSYLGKNLHLKTNHPLSLMRQRITNFFYKEYSNPKGTPTFSVYDRLDPVVTVKQNFDSLLIPAEHPSRCKSECYYINRNYMLRAHCTAHQVELLRSGLNNFLIIGDVYRRDEIDSTHFPVFHQVDAVRVIHNDKLFKDNPDLTIFEKEYNNKTISTLQVPPGTSEKCIDQVKQACHTVEAVKLIEFEMKNLLERLVTFLFGKQLKYRWVDAYFPFTQPSWELEIFYNDKWFEILGCGIMRNEILNEAGVINSIGFAFGLGLERLAMIIYDIPDIRLFWSQDSGFLTQFSEKELHKNFKYKAISQYPQCSNDLSFWLPNESTFETFSLNDVYDAVRDVGGDIVEQVIVLDKFTHPKTKRNSLTIRIIYRHMERTLTQEEVNEIHSMIAKVLVQNYNVKIR